MKPQRRSTDLVNDDMMMVDVTAEETREKVETVTNDLWRTP